MGIAAKLFHNPEDRENTLAYRVRPSDEQIAEQQERWNNLADVVKEGLRGTYGKPVSSWLQGSYKFGTQIRPARMGEEFDIDLGVYIEWEGSAESGDVEPLELKDKIQSILDDYADEPTNDATGTSDPKSRCNRICFTDDFHIDVPSYHLDRTADARDLATQDDEWENSDPKAIYVWWKDQFEGGERDRARRLARYLKMWAALTFESASRPSSILLTVLVARALNSTDTDGISGDDEFFRTVVDQIERRLRRSVVVRNPANTHENLNRLSDDACAAFIDKLGELLSVADRALGADDEFGSADIWTEAFKHFFPFPKEDEQAVAKAADSARNVMAVARYDPDVQVVATSGNRRWEGFNSLGPIPKGCDIRFEVVNPRTLPEGSTVYWTVRNEGAEAEATNDLGHVAGTGLTNKENSAYRGRHFVDVVVKLNGRIIGRRRVKVQISGLGIPKRNSARPAWTALR
ncbi:MAG: CBASS cGAMP synthase [Pseudomonadota bacterium]